MVSKISHKTRLLEIAFQQYFAIDLPLNFPNVGDNNKKRNTSSFVSNSRCASCIGESARAQWFRHSDGWRSGSSTLGSSQGGAPPSQGARGSLPPAPPRRSPWDSLPSLRHEGSLNDSGYKSNRADSLEQRYFYRFISRSIQSVLPSLAATSSLEPRIPGVSWP